MVGIAAIRALVRIGSDGGAEGLSVYRFMRICNVAMSNAAVEEIRARVDNGTPIEIRP